MALNGSKGIPVAPQALVSESFDGNDILELVGDYQLKTHSHGHGHGHGVGDDGCDDASHHHNHGHGHGHGHGDSHDASAAPIVTTRKKIPITILTGFLGAGTSRPIRGCFF